MANLELPVNLTHACLWEEAKVPWESAHKQTMQDLCKRGPLAVRCEIDCYHACLRYVWETLFWWVISNYLENAEFHDYILMFKLCKSKPSSWLCGNTPKEGFCRSKNIIFLLFSLDDWIWCQVMLVCSKHMKMPDSTGFRLWCVNKRIVSDSITVKKILLILQ